MVGGETSRAERVAAFEIECRRRGLSITSSRRVIFDALLERRDHPTADQIYDAVRPRLPSLSRTTVYRVLETLVGIGAVRKVHHTDAIARFDPITSRHHHLVCERCGRLVDIDDSDVGAVEAPASANGFRITDYSISFTGVCADC